MARDIYRNDYYRKGGKAFLPVRWMPPESFLDGLFTSKTDVWAYGVLLWEIFSLGYIPYPGRDNLEVMRLVVAGDRLDPPIGIPDEIYELMLRCWNTESEQRPNFVDLVGTFETLLKNKDLVAEPLPPMRNRLINERSVSGTPSISSRACDAQPTSTISQATISTGVYSSNGWTGACSSTSTYETMPIIGDGVCRAVFPPYQSRQSEEKFIRLYDKKRSEEKSSDECASQDESAGTVKLRNCIIKPSFLDSNQRNNASEKVYNRCFRWSRRPSLPDTTLPNEQRDHSLPPFPSMRSTTVRQCDDQDSGIASARSFEDTKQLLKMSRSIILPFILILTAQIIFCKSHGPNYGATFFLIKSLSDDVLKSNGGVLNRWGKRSISTTSNLQLLKRLQQRNDDTQAIGDYVNNARVMRSASKQTPDWSDLGWAWG
ncbi:hypothetical protein ACQ4LE_007649 [Meloidogyne hapla]